VCELGTSSDKEAQDCLDDNALCRFTPIRPPQSTLPWPAPTSWGNLLRQRKTLCYNIPVCEALVTEKAGRALYLFPTKALAQDHIA